MQSLTKEEQQPLKSLTNDQSIIICKPNKGQGAAVSHKLDYIAKMEKVIFDKIAFRQVTKNDNVSNLEKYQIFLYQLKKNKNLDDSIYQEIRPRAASTPCLYALLKLQKDNCPLSPISSATGFFTYQIASWIRNILKPLCKHSTVLQDLFEFVNQISKILNL